MKILLINNCHYRRGGSEAVYFGTADLLRSHGHEVVFFSIEDDKNIHTDSVEYFVKKGGKISQIRDYFCNPNAARILEDILKKEKPDIAHVHLFWGGISPSIFKVLKNHHIPLVHTAHDYRMVCPAYTFKDGSDNTCERCRRWNYYQCAFHRCSKGSLMQSTLMAMEMYTRQMFFNPIKNISGFVFVSHFSAQKHLEHYKKFEEARHLVLYNYTNPLMKPETIKKGNYFLFYGRLSFEKGIPTLLKVFARHPEWKLKVVGTGPLEEKLQAEYPTKENAPAGALAQQKKCYENIQFLGYHSGGTLAELVRSARFVCVPSECYENNPMTIVESYSFGTPVIGADIGGIPEIIDEGSTGFLFKSGDDTDLESSIVKALSIEEEKYIRMCDNAYTFYERHFSADSHYKALIGFYNEVMEAYQK